VRHGIALVEGDRVAAVAVLVRETVGGFGERIVATDLLPPRSAVRHGPAEAVRVGMHVLKSDRLRADVAAAQDVLVVATDRADLAVLDLDGDAAQRLAEAACPQMSDQGGRSCSLGVGESRRPAELDS
jgi:alpha-D-ribose 1-methylphosphonate 5-triphosphate synthase subunit PhnG